MRQDRNTATRSLAGGIAPLPDLICEASEPSAAEIVPADLDDATTAYVLFMRAPFDLVRQSISQLAGLMILAAAGSKQGVPEPMWDRAIEACAEAEESISTASVPPRALHHHRHLTRANHALAIALKSSHRHSIRRDAATLDAVLGPLRAAHTELQHAARTLPGFETVALSQACCTQPARHRLVDIEGGVPG